MGVHPVRAMAKAKKVKNVALKRTKAATGKKGHAASVPVCRNASFKRSGAWAVKKKNGGKWPVHKKAEKKPAADKAPRFYASEDIPVPFARRSVAKPATLKASITPGTVLMLVAGPLKVNGVPLRRVNQTFTIATSTKVPLTGVDVSKIDDAYFAKAAKKAPKGADGFFKEGGNKEELSAQRKADQKTVDTALLATIKKTEFLKAYLNARFSLSKGDAPHAMKF